jgi:DNA-binding NarL/FixJ family response regulator
MLLTQKGKSMNLTERERTILLLSGQGLSDYRIARKINTDPPSVTRSRKNAHAKLLNALTDLEWATKIGVSLSELNTNNENSSTWQYIFFL